MKRHSLMSATATPSELLRVTRAAAKVEAAQADFVEALRDARAAGLPLRPIARAAGLSVEWTRRLTTEASS